RTHRVLLVEPGNVASLAKQEGRWRIGSLLVEPISACNAECVYCPHRRTGARLELKLLESFLEEKVGHVDHIQFGCGHEPTAHTGLIQYFELVAAFRRKPRTIGMVTNGTLLHRHDVRK